MMSLRNSIDKIVEDTYQRSIVETFMVSNTNLISDIVLELVEEANLNLDCLDNEEIFEAFIDDAIYLAADELNEGIIKDAIARVKSVFGKQKQDHSEAPNLLRPHPSRVTSHFTPNPKRQAAQTASYMTPNPKRSAAANFAKAAIKKKTYSGAAAKTHLKSQLSDEHKAALKDYKLSSRTHKDGTVKHYLIHKETGKKIHVATSSNNSGSWSHTKHE